MLDALTTSEETKRAVTFDALLPTTPSRHRPRRSSRSLTVSSAEAPAAGLRETAVLRALARPPGAERREMVQDRHRLLAVPRCPDVIADATRRASLPDRLETLIGKARIAKLIAPYRERLRLSDPQRRLMFWSAAYFGTENLDFWARLFGIERRSTPCVRCSPIPRRRRASARHGRRTAWHRGARPERRLRRDGALRDDNARACGQPGARTGANRAGHRHPRASDRTRIQSNAVERALDVLATFVEVDGPIERFSRVALPAAGDCARRRTLARRRGKQSSPAPSAVH